MCEKIQFVKGTLPLFSVPFFPNEKELKDSGVHETRWNDEWVFSYWWNYAN